MACKKKEGKKEASIDELRKVTEVRGGGLACFAPDCTGLHAIRRGAVGRQLEFGAVQGSVSVSGWESGCGAAMMSGSLRTPLQVEPGKDIGQC